MNVGVEWDSGDPSPVLARLGDAADLTPGADFDNIDPMGSMRRVTIDNSGRVTSVYGQNCFDDSFAGNVNLGPCMVYVKPFHSYVDVTGLAGEGIVRWWIADVGETITNYDDTTYPITSADRHPAFKANGRARERLYYGAHHAYDDGTRLYSCKDVYPTVNQNIETFRSHAWARNPVAGTWGPWNINTTQAIAAVQLSYIIEYAHLDSQSDTNGINTGVTNLLDMSYICKTGHTASLGNASGSVVFNPQDDVPACSVTSTNSVSYRGIGDVFGLAGEFLDGINVYNGLIFISDNNFTSDVNNGFLTPYTTTGITAELGTTYMKNINVSNSDYRWMFVASEHSDVASYFYDLYRVLADKRIVAHGNGPWEGGYGGMFSINAGAQPLTTYTNLGTRLTCLV